MDLPTKRAAEQDEARERFAKLIRMHLFADDSSISECAERMRICPSTLYRCMKDPGDFTLSDLRLVQMALGIPQNALLEAVEPLIGKDIA